MWRSWLCASVCRRWCGGVEVFAKRVCTPVQFFGWGAGTATLTFLFPTGPVGFKGLSCGGSVQIVCLPAATPQPDLKRVLRAVPLMPPGRGGGRAF